MFSKGSCQNIGSVTRKDTQKLNYYGRHFVFEMGKVIRIHEPRHDKTNKMVVHPAKTQISLGIRPV